MRYISNVIFAQHMIFRNVPAYRAKYTGLQEAGLKMKRILNRQCTLGFIPLAQHLGLKMPGEKWPGWAVGFQLISFVWRIQYILLFTDGGQDKIQELNRPRANLIPPLEWVRMSNSVLKERILWNKLLNSTIIYRILYVWENVEQHLVSNS